MVLRSAWLVPLMLSLAFGSLAAINTVNEIRDRSRERQLLCCGVPTTARVIRCYEQRLPSSDTVGITFHVVYSYEATQTFTRDEQVSSEVYSNAIPDEGLAIRYLGSDPAISRIEGNTYRDPHLAMAVLWWVAFIPSLYTLISRLQRRAVVSR